MRKALLAGVCVFLVPLFSVAQYYSFKENSSPQWAEPSELFVQAARLTHDLLHWTQHKSQRPEAPERYNRLYHFGTWVDDPRTPECFDVRALILMRDSQTRVQMSDVSPCKVFAGSWNDPYGGANWKLAREIEIDHVVALKNAYTSGAWAWDYQHRCLFANFTGFDKHLLSSFITENRQKSDRGPEDWMPSNENYSCQHLHNWLAVKFIWNLTMTSAEAEAIAEQIEIHRCNVKAFQFSKGELNRIRRFAQANLAMCRHQ